MEVKEYQPYKEKYSLEQRKNQTTTERSKYPHMIPVIIEISKRAKNVKILQKQKFLMSEHIKLYELQQIVYKKLKGSENGEKGVIFFFIRDKNIVKINKTIEELYEQFKDQDDGYLYITYSDQETFGQS